MAKKSNIINLGSSKSINWLHAQDFIKRWNEGATTYTLKTSGSTGTPGGITDIPSGEPLEGDTFVVYYFPPYPGFSKMDFNRKVVNGKVVFRLSKE